MKLKTRVPAGVETGSGRLKELMTEPSVWDSQDMHLGSLRLCSGRTLR